jgi:hypothetical protein
MGAPSARAPAGPPISGEIGLGVVGGLGSAPVRTLGVAARGALRRSNLSLGIEARADLPAEVPLEVGRVSTSLLVASAVPCVHIRVLAGCALVTAGALRAAGHGLVDARRVSVPYLALGARVRVAVPLGSRVALTLHSDLAAPLTQTELTVGGEELWTTPPVSLTLGLGVAMTLS